ncbi:MAG: tRNA pseudouridine(55) synthase TruB [Erysipelotrichaceae bacterium]|nr:tRNA pseudouridine(55) synthase TruB [Erysipelotrichaceae bacterium]
MAEVLYVNKPSGISSFDVCFKLRKVLHTKKIGHTGTLDPNATGVMIVLFDKSTKANQFLVTDRKEYETRVLLGKETDTLDIDGNVLGEYKYEVPDENTLKNALNAFKGRSVQEVPITSAVSVDGKRLYQYQKEGKQVELPKREIEVFSVELLNIYEDGFSFISRVSSGTYIRALVRDILSSLNLHGTVLTLKRTAVDDVRIEDCDELNDILEGNYHLHDLYDLLSKRYEVFEDFDEKDVLNGKKLLIESDQPRLLMAKNHEALAIYEKDGDLYRSLRGLW